MIQQDKPTNFEKKYGLPASVRKLKITHKIRTVDDLLARSDVNDVLSDIVSQKKDITDLICIYKTTDGSIFYSYAVKETDKSDEVIKALGIIEYAKDMILHPSNECEDDE